MFGAILGEQVVSKLMAREALNKPHAYVGSHYERTGHALIKKCAASRRDYYVGERRIAMRTGGQTYYLFLDHLGSTHITASSVNGAELGRLLYRPWGETRVSTGTTLTTWRFTGQREDATIGLYFYNARYYDPLLGRFAQADTIVPNPGDPQALNRYSYALNNAVRYTDPTGMFSEDEIMKYLGVTTWDEVLAMFGEGGAMAGVWGYLEALREAQLGTPIKMWFDVSYGFNKNQPDMTGIFYEQNGALMFAATFTNWSGAGVSWSVVGLSATAASQTLVAAAIYQVGSLGSYLASKPAVHTSSV